jgi:hypothetical protein|tara:strand:+ start:74 stop:637 length:564 start_codon:yes stop_codon:yes gene_type:complete
MSEKHNDAVAHANTPVQAAKKALQSLAESKTANEVDDVVAELERSSLQDPKQTSPLLQKQERAKRRRSSKLDSMQDLLASFQSSQQNVQSALREVKRRQAEVDQTLEFNERRIRLTQTVIRTMENVRRRHTLNEGEGHSELYEKLRRAKLKIKKKGTVAKLAKLGYDKDGVKMSAKEDKEGSAGSKK